MFSPHSSPSPESYSSRSSLSDSMEPSVESHSKGSDLKKQFDAAVNVIRNLPTNGNAKDAPFQPSDELRLKFYAFFKQATEGPNNTPKPAFYDVVGTYKWKAWTSLGQMSQEEAMLGYVKELTKIIETMSLTKPVAEFYDVLGPFYDFVFPNKSAQPKANGHVIQSTSSTSLNGKSNGLLLNGDSNDNESDGEEFSDTYASYENDNSASQASVRGFNADEIISARGEAELTSPRFGTASSSARLSSSRSQPPRPGRSSSSSGPGAASGTSGDGSDEPGRQDAVPEVNEQIAFAILRLQQSMEQVESRLHSLEQQIRNSNLSPSNDHFNRVSDKTVRGWWPLAGVSPSTALFFMIWPIITQIAIERIRNHRSSK